MVRRRVLGSAAAKPLNLNIPSGVIPAIRGVKELNDLEQSLRSRGNPSLARISSPKNRYFWTRTGDNNHTDFLVTANFDDDTFGEIIAVTDVPTSGNSPCHLSPSINGKTLRGGGPLSLLKGLYCGTYASRNCGRSLGRRASKDRHGCNLVP
ncbi:hypothetical protein VUR80DRAFT_6559 [Thermomyces stellatus]